MRHLLGRLGEQLATVLVHNLLMSVTNLPYFLILIRFRECVTVVEGARGSCCILSYGLEGTDFLFRQGQGTFPFSQHSRPHRCETQPASYSVGTEITGLLALGKGPGDEYDHTPPSNAEFNSLKTKRRQLYLKTQSVPRCKHFSSRL